MDYPAELEMTPQQSRLWQAEQLKGEPQHVYTLSRVLSVGGVVAPRDIVRSFIARHEALRTKVALRNGVPRIVIDGPDQAEEYMHDLTSGAQQHCVQIPGHATAAFLEMGTSQVRMSLKIHHITIDMWGMIVLARDFDAFVEGQASEVLKQPSEYALPESFRIYSNNLRREQREISRNFMPEKTAKIRANPQASGSFRDGQRSIMILPNAVLEMVAELREVFQATDFVAWHAGIGLVLSKYLEISRMAVRSTTANRRTKEDKQAIACLSGESVFDISLPSDDKVASYFAKIGQEMVRVFMHSPYDYSLMVDYLTRLAPAKPRPLVAATNLMYPLISYPNAPEAPRNSPVDITATYSEERVDFGAVGEHLSLMVTTNSDGMLVAEAVTSSVLPGPPTIMSSIISAMNYLAVNPAGRLSDFTLH